MVWIPTNTVGHKALQIVVGQEQKSTIPQCQQPTLIEADNDGD